MALDRSLDMSRPLELDGIQRKGTVSVDLELMWVTTRLCEANFLAFG